jgi:trigger factor
VKSVAESLGPTRVKLRVEVPFAELQPSLDEAYKRISSQVNVPGFRKGKVPSRIIDQRFGRGVVLEEAINEALPTLYSQAVEAAELSPLGTPEVDITEIEDGERLTFTAEVDVRPEIEMPQWEGVALTVADVEVDDEAVQEQLQQLRRRFGTLHPVERAAAEGDHVTIDLGALDEDGEPIENGVATGLSYLVGSDTMVEGLDEAIIGLSAGESTTFTTTLMGEEDGLEAQVDVTVTAVKEQELPELDDEFAMLASEFDTLDELRTDIEEQLLRAGRLGQALAARDKALEYLLDTVEVPVPEGIIAAQLEDHFADGHGDDEHRAEVEEQAIRSLKAQLILDEIVKAAEVQVSQEELTAYLIQRAQRSGMSPQDFADQMVRSGNVPSVVADVARGKALALVVEKAVVTDGSGNVVDLARLQEDGTLADETQAEAEEADEQRTEQVGTAEAGGDAAGEDQPAAVGDVPFAEVVDTGTPAQDAPTANSDRLAE